MRRGSSLRASPKRWRQVPPRRSLRRPMPRKRPPLQEILTRTARPRSRLTPPDLRAGRSAARAARHRPAPRPKGPPWKRRLPRRAPQGARAGPGVLRPKIPARTQSRHRPPARKSRPLRVSIRRRRPLSCHPAASPPPTSRQRGGCRRSIPRPRRNRILTRLAPLRTIPPRPPRALRRLPKPPSAGAAPGLQSRRIRRPRGLRGHRSRRGCGRNRRRTGRRRGSRWDCAAHDVSMTTGSSRCASAPAPGRGRPVPRTRRCAGLRVPRRTVHSKRPDRVEPRCAEPFRVSIEGRAVPASQEGRTNRGERRNRPSDRHHRQEQARPARGVAQAAVA